MPDRVAAWSQILAALPMVFNDFAPCRRPHGPIESKYGETVEMVHDPRSGGPAEDQRSIGAAEAE
jgi:hypothetical protein